MNSLTFKPIKDPMQDFIRSFCRQEVKEQVYAEYRRGLSLSERAKLRRIEQDYLTQTPAKIAA